MEYKKSLIFTTTTTTTNFIYMQKTTTDLDERDMTKDEAEFHHQTLVKYREGDIVPSAQTLARKTRVALNTARNFMYANSKNPEIMAFLRERVAKNFTSIPDDWAKLFAIWDRITKV